MAKLTHQQRQVDRAQQVYDLIRDCPGVGKTDIARGLGITPSMVHNSLIYMERLGLFVSEADGKFYPFGLVSVNDALELLGV